MQRLPENFFYKFKDLTLGDKVSGIISIFSSVGINFLMNQEN
jgi:hypothetical protein